MCWSRFSFLFQFTSIGDLQKWGHMSTKNTVLLWTEVPVNRYLLTKNKGFINFALSHVAFSPVQNSQITLLQPAPFMICLHIKCPLLLILSPLICTALLCVVWLPEKKKVRQEVTVTKWLSECSVCYLNCHLTLCGIKFKRKKEFKWSVIATRNKPLSFHSTCVREATW